MSSKPVSLPTTLTCENPDECADWYALFRTFDTDNDGFIPTNDLRAIIQRSSYAFGLDDSQAEALVFEVDANKDHLVDFPEFCTLMARAKKMHMRRVILYAARSILPRSQQTDNFRYLLQYNCFPPPVFMITITLVQIGIYLYYALPSKEGIDPLGPVPVGSPYILAPHSKAEIWRYFTYMFIHAGYIHILSNAAVQLLLGIPLELVHKFWRIGLIYLLGVMSGALLFFVFERHTYLAGASGGVYALLSAHVANVIINWSEMEFNWIRAIILSVFIIADISTAVYQRFIENAITKTSYISHLGGFIAGLLLGIVVLRNLRRLAWENYAWWVALVAFILYVIVCVVLMIAPPLF
uniref:rhomboid protease n=1 Tax=Acrobeloides nanus TaxID=290746 RepID=A0A914EB71_9BILA